MSALYASGTYADLEQGLPEPEVAEPRQDAVADCALNLLESVGKPQKDDQLPELYRKHSQSQDEEFLQYLFSIIYVESRFNRAAVSEKDAYGLLQLTRIAAEEVIRQGQCNLRPLADMARLHDSVTNIKYGSCYLKQMLDFAEGDWTRALILYNGGYAQLSKYDRGETITQETSNYVLKVERALKYICRKSRPVSGTVN